MWGSGDTRFFDLVAPLYDLVHPSADDARFRNALDHVEGDLDLVLDVAGGTGRVASALDPETVVLDASAGMLRRATVPAVRADAGRLPVRSGAADAAICVDAFHHLPEPGASITEMARAVRPGGVVAIVDFDPGTIRGRGLVLAEHAIGMNSTFHAPAEIAAAFEEAGLDASIEEEGFVSVVVGVVPERDD